MPELEGPAYFYKARALEERGDLKEAAAFYKMVLSLNSDSFPEPFDIWQKVFGTYDETRLKAKAKLSLEHL